MNISRWYFDRELFYSNSDKGIVTTKYSSLSDIPLHNYFEIEYFRSQRRISFKTLTMPYDEVYDFPRNKFLAYEDGKLSLVNHQYLFEIELVGSKKELFTNEAFLIKIPGSSLFMKSLPSEHKGIHRLEVSNLDEKSRDCYYFYVFSMQAPSNLDMNDLINISFRFELHIKYLANMNKEAIKGKTIDNLMTTYNEAKEWLHPTFWSFKNRQSNGYKGRQNEHMWLNSRS